MATQQNQKNQVIILRCNTTKAAIIHTGITLDRLRACGHNGLVLFTGSVTDLYYYEWGNETSGHVSLGVYQNDVARNLGTTIKSCVTKLNIQFNNPNA